MSAPSSAPSCCQAESLRCGCGNLLARLVEGGVELKCRRCKRVVVIPLSEGTESRPVLRGAR